MRHTYRPGDVIRIEAIHIEEGIDFHGCECTVGTCLYGRDVTDLILTEHKTGLTLLATSDEVSFVRNGSVWS
ncbi:hypothetical protein [Prauserella endophytica]|uniref:Uncharacterized protein n=1 Tax=Prauserella endophytica TaxID=1592324 RepID=A0ABY2S0D4_9PSEU|nr:hypothetical protein [Prauserella endophytica]TKG67021.1 hypothetical protein FCN18_24250 [Prauserella endophytica]